MNGDFAGPYGWKYHPWVKSLHDTRAGYNYVMKGAQLGITEVAINRALYTLDKLKRDVLYVLPTAKGASKFSKGRFSTALSLSPYIKGIFTNLNSIDLKQAGQNTLYISGSRGNNNLKNIPVSELILDEVDEMEQKQIWLALERLSGQLRKCVWGISTPTVPEHGIHKLYKDSTQEHFTFQCPACGRWTELVWPDCIEVIGEHATDARCNESYLKCKEC
jgi:phage terminase large subunit GpA-like protein